MAPFTSTQSIPIASAFGCSKVEHNDVGVCAFADFAAILELEVARGEAAHLVHGGFERKQSQLAAVMPEHAGKGSP